MAEKNTGEIHSPPPPSTPRVAPWDAVQELCNRLDRLITVLEAWTPGGIPGVPGVEVEVATIWEAGPKQELMVPTAINTIGVTDTEMVSWEKGKRLLIKVTSTLDVAIVVQPVGNIDNTMDSATNIGAPLPLPAATNMHVGFAWGDWHPFIGIRLTHAIAPTGGTAKVEAMVQE